MSGFRSTERYIASRDLEVAVNAAVALQRPLLVKGEPGTGKTVLAHEVAAALGYPLVEWHVKSTTKAQQGLYEYDAVSRLRDSQLGDPKVADIANYIVRGKLWDAFDADRPQVVLIDEIILTLEQLNTPKVFAELALKPRGLVLVTGPTGSGKSTTLAAMVNHLNENEFGHVLTVEDPIEFVHESKKCLINQREVGPHTLSFNNALRSALREDPDAILVGELRDLETIRLALTAAETGHLVFGTLHTSSAAKTIDRVVDVFPAAEKEMVRAMLSESLIGVISQTLCKTKDGSGRVAAHEIMLGTAAIRNLIREAKIAQMYSSIQTSNAVGMQTLDQNLADLVRRNVIAPAEARGKAKFPENFPG